MKLIDTPVGKGVTEETFYPYHDCVECPDKVSDDFFLTVYNRSDLPCVVTLILSVSLS